jgi:hypothetical protein
VEGEKTAADNGVISDCPSDELYDSNKATNPKKVHLKAICFGGSTCLCSLAKENPTYLSMVNFIVK